jgi:hypothetical protein
MSIPKIITAKNASAILNALMIDLNNVPIEDFKEIFSESKKYISGKKLFNLIYQNYNEKLKPEFKTYLQSEVNFLLEDIYLQKQHQGLQNLIIDSYNTKVTLKLVGNSSLDDIAKTHYYQSVINYVYAYDIGEEISQAYEKYDIHMTNKNYSNWYLNDKTLKNLVKATQFKDDIKKLDSKVQLSLFTRLCKSSVTAKQLEPLIPSFNKLLSHSIDKLSPLKLGANQKAFLFYEKNNIKLQYALTPLKLEDFLNQFSKKEYNLLLKQLAKENNSYLFEETSLVKELNAERVGNIAHNWLNVKDIINFKNEKLSRNENFLNLTQKILNKFKNKIVHEKLNEAMTTIEKEVFEEKMIASPNVSTKKMKI